MARVAKLDMKRAPPAFIVFDARADMCVSFHLTGKSDNTMTFSSPMWRKECPVRDAREQFSDLDPAACVPAGTVTPDLAFRDQIQWFPIPISLSRPDIQSRAVRASPEALGRRAGAGTSFPHREMLSRCTSSPTTTTVHSGSKRSKASATAKPRMTIKTMSEAKTAL